MKPASPAQARPLSGSLTKGADDLVVIDAGHRLSISGGSFGAYGARLAAVVDRGRLQVSDGSLWLGLLDNTTGRIEIFNGKILQLNEGVLLGGTVAGVGLGQIEMGTAASMADLRLDGALLSADARVSCALSFADGTSLTVIDGASSQRCTPKRPAATASSA